MDQVTVTGCGVNGIDELLSYATQLGQDVVITFDRDTSLTLEDVQLDELSVDFNFGM